MARFVFGEFQLDTDERRLSRSGIEIRLRGKLFDTLSVFLEHPGKLLRKGELLQKSGLTRLWKKTTSTTASRNFGKSLAVGSADLSKPFRDRAIASSVPWAITMALSVHSMWARGNRGRLLKCPRKRFGRS